MFGGIPALDKNWTSETTDIFRLMASSVRYRMKPAIIDFKKTEHVVNGTIKEFYKVKANFYL